MAAKTASRRRPAEAPGQRLVDRALKLGALAAKVIDPSTVETRQWVRWKCRFGCGCYGSSLVCPPHSPAPSETRAMLDEYTEAVLFEAPPGRTKEIAAALERELFLAGRYQALGLGAGPCQLCKTCRFEEGCRHPQAARPAMEACGIDVFATVRKHGFALDVVRSPEDPQHYFGLVLVS